ncbi:MAG: molybdenum cofactor guanylyltransferase [Nitrospirota bacterium]|nr:molybdenum cofactor guanylyltransferase [Nitrospirota bacterium]
MKNFIRDCTGVILAGGENTRMPVLKAFISVSGTPIIERNLSVMKQLFREVFIVTNQPENYVHLETPMLGDVCDIRGPMTGVFTSLLNSRDRWVFISACDMPFLNSRLIGYMASKRTGHDAVVPITDKGPEPLFAFYSARLAASMERKVLTGKRGLKDFLNHKKVKYIPSSEIKEFDQEGRSFINLNTPEDVRHHLGPLVRI